MNKSFVVCIFLLMLSCSTTNRNIKEAIELNNIADELYERADELMFISNGKDSVLVDSLYKAALVLLEEAEQKDATNPTVAANKFKIEFMLKDYDSAIATFEKFESRNGSLYPALRLGLGICYIKKGKVDKAQEVFKIAGNEFLINGDSINYYFTRCFIDGKESVIRQIDTIPSLNGLKEIILQMDMNIDEMIR